MITPFFPIHMSQRIPGGENNTKYAICHTGTTFVAANILIFISSHKCREFLTIVSSPAIFVKSQGLENIYSIQFRTEQF